MIRRSVIERILLGVLLVTVLWWFLGGAVFAAWMAAYYTDEGNRNPCGQLMIALASHSFMTQRVGLTVFPTLCQSGKTEWWVSGSASLRSPPRFARILSYYPRIAADFRAARLQA